jgi:uncharacterized membrane protein YedE/YeeE
MNFRVTCFGNLQVGPIFPRSTITYLNMAATLGSIFSGSLFGAALTYASVYYPNIIIDQMLLRNMHMLRVFLTATSSSAYVFLNAKCTIKTKTNLHSLMILFLSHSNIYKPIPRSPQTLSILSIPYSANILGGLLLGVAMSLTGACPGTIIPQAANGISSAASALSGAVLGGIGWAAVGNHLRKSTAVPISEHNKSFQGLLGLSYSSTVLAYIAVCVTLIASAGIIDGADFLDKGLKRAITGGLAIGVVQGISILSTGNSIGSSAVFEDIGRWVVYLSAKETSPSGQRSRKEERAHEKDIPKEKQKQPPISSIVFTIGAFIGSLLVSYITKNNTSLNPTLTHTQDGSLVVPIPAARALAGGFLLSFGARLAGGCTSGHGISGMSMMSVASLVSVVAMFTGGILGARVF